LGLSDDDEALTDIMVGYWANFAKTGNPNGTGVEGESLPNWPQHAGSQWMHLSANTGRPIAVVEANIRDAKLNSLQEGLDLKLEQLAAATSSADVATAETALDD
jgi:para-nitrobenzyl esterase